MTPTTLTVYRVPRAVFVIACSVAVFVLFMVMARLPGAAIGPAIAFVAGAIGVAAVYFPHPAAQVAGSSQPGLLAVVAVLLIQLAVRWQHRHRVTHLPGFTRGAPEPLAVSVAVPSTSRNRQPAAGSTGAAPVAPAGG